MTNTLKISDLKPPFKLVEGKTGYKGSPVPYTQLWRDGTPVYTDVDPVKIRKCLEKRLCGVCGQVLGKELWFVGGINSTVYMDAPMHERCADFSLQVCPFLNGERLREDEAQELALRFDSGVYGKLKAKGYNWNPNANTFAIVPVI